MKFLCIFVLISSLFTPLAWSQCAPGVPSAGNPSCIPPNQQNSPYYQGNTVQQQQVPQPQLVWADRWGAIVIGGDIADISTASGRATQSQAIETTMDGCASHGAKNCKLELAYHNQCAAVAWGNSRHGTASAPTESLAKSDAMKYCGEASCKIVYSGCSLAERVR